MEILNDKQLNTLNRIQHGVQTYGEYLIQAMLGLYLLIGFSVIDDYGISMDEPIQRKHGIISFEYANQHLGIFPKIPKTREEHLMTYDHREYGVFFQMVSYGIEQLLGIKSARSVFLLRHIFVFLLFWVSCYCFSKLLYLRYQKWWISLLGTLFLILSPRIFAQAFYNPKDIVFMSWTLISIYTLALSLEYKTYKYVLIHGLICALAINARVTGIFIPVLSLILLGLSFFQEKLIAKGLSTLGLFVATTIFCTILFWPFLWESPLVHFFSSFNRMKQFDWYGEVWYLGRYVSSTNMPWHYIPVLLGVTTPILYVLLFFVGLFTLFIKHFPQKFIFPFPLSLNSLIDLVYLGYFFVPLVAVIVLESVLYNGWRHLYFIYPAFLLIAIHGVYQLNYWASQKRIIHSKRYVDAILGVILLLSISKTLVEMIRLHPHQQVYFNDLVGENPHLRFEMDYYGTSYKQALAYLLKYADQGQINVHVTSPSGKINMVNFPKKEMERLNFVSLEKADYLISNFHFPSDSWSFQIYLAQQYPYSSPEVFTEKYRGSRIISLYDLRSPF